MHLSKILIVVPCFNEASRLSVEAYRQFLSANERFGFLFVNDGSTDGTREVLESLKTHSPGRVEVLHLKPNRGKAEAVRAGMLKGMEDKPDFIGFWDADLATPLEVLPYFMDRFDGKPERLMVFGSRVKLLGHDIRRQPLRHYLGRVFATFASAVLGLPVYDTQCGAKIFRVQGPLARMIEKPFLSRWIFDVELIARFLEIQRPSLPEAEQMIYELALPAWYDVAGSKVKPADFFKAIGELWRIRCAYRMR